MRQGSYNRVSGLTRIILSLTVFIFAVYSKYIDFVGGYVL